MKIIQLLLITLLGFSSFQMIENDKTILDNKPKNRIEVIDFHTTHRCKTCLKIENNAKKLLLSTYKKQMNSGKISFQTINIDKKENYKMAERYEAAGSALFINVIKNGKETHIDLTDFAFMNAFNDEKFAKELKTKIDKQLKTL
jgi:hypothetical protein